MTTIEKVLKNSEEYIRKLFEGIPIPIYVWQRYDNDFILVDYNDAANKDLKDKYYKKNKIKASEFYKDNPKIIKDLNKCFIRKRNISKDRRYTVKSTQELRYLNIRYSFIPPELVLMHKEDITEKKLARQKIIASEMKCKQLNKELEQKVKERTKKLVKSEKNYREVLDNLDVGFYQVTLDGHMINLNQAHKIILGYEPSDNLKNKDVRMFWQYPEQREEYIKLLLEKGSVRDYICHSLTKTGKKIVVQLNSHLIKDKKGNPIRIDGTFIDITEKFTLQQKIKESEEKYRIISENANDLIGILNKEFKYEYINEDTFLQVLGYRSTDLIGRSALDFIHSKDIAHAVNALKQGFEKGKGSAELRFKHKKGYWVWIEAKGTTFLDKTGGLKALIISRDITERKKTVQKLKESEEKFRIIAEQSFLAIIIMKDFQIKYANQKLSEISGFSTEEMLNWAPREFFNLIYPEDRENVIQIAEKRYKGLINEIKNLQFRMLNKTGEVAWIEIFSKSIHYKGERADLISIMDITDKKLAEEKLKESEEKFRHLFNTSPYSVIIFGLNGNIIDCNYTTKKLFGYEKKDIVNKSFTELSIFPQEQIPQFLERQNRLLKGELPEHLDFQVHKKNGTLIWAHAINSLIEISGKKIIQVIIQDITAKKEAEQKLKKSEKLYREAYNRASFYKDIFAHDINNILQIMNSSAELISLQLNNNEKSKDIENIADIIKKQVIRGTKLVHNVTILSALEESEISVQSLEVYNLLLKSIEYVRRAYNERDVDIQIDCPNKEIYIMANELLQDVFENILINAVKYNENPTTEIIIKISRQRDEINNFYRFEFIDNGIGIHDERKNFIFKRGNGDPKSSKGMGLGLSLVSKIIEYYHGKIWVEDRVKGDYSQGSKFILLLLEAT